MSNDDTPEQLVAVDVEMTPEQIAEWNRLLADAFQERPARHRAQFVECPIDELADRRKRHEQ